ncbi:uncharacterized protein VP01_400g5 [Puccinia sorghi]|uniref:Uncharacterized protein n=1 Tax=Puccinia sorghi TaxID=27349 RepID=A0A0L6URW9_9BASI|nr:uncharacterized protein VP01_400g5 [Puccinia sorghi]
MGRCRELHTRLRGLFASAFRHDVPLLYASVYKSGEKYVPFPSQLYSPVSHFFSCRLHYPISIINTILPQFPLSQFGILYDIGCQLETHITKLTFCFLPQHNFFPERQADMTFGTSVFHAYVHEWPCQMGKDLSAFGHFSPLWSPISVYLITSIDLFGYIVEVSIRGLNQTSGK